MFKKFFTFFICFNILSSPAYCTIDDDFVKKTLLSTAKRKTLQIPSIKDDFAEKTINKNSKPKTINYKMIVDDFAEKNTNKNQYTKHNIAIEEKITLPTQNIIVKQRKSIIINEDNSTPIKIRIKKHLSTKQKIDEGDFLEFETVSENTINNKVYPAGTTVKARIETVSLNKIWGVPSDLTIGNFNIDGNILNGEINKIGANRSLWVYPTVYITTFFFGAGLFLIPIRGGHAKIKPHQIYTVHHVTSR